MLLTTQCSHISSTMTFIDESAQTGEVWLCMRRNGRIECVDIRNINPEDLSPPNERIDL